MKKYKYTTSLDWQNEYNRLVAFLQNKPELQRVQPKSVQSSDILDFFNNPENNKEITIINIPMKNVIPYIKLNKNYNLLLESNGNYWTINNGNLEKIIYELKNEIIELEETIGSDAEIINILLRPILSEIKFIWREKKRQRPNGGYFKYYHKLDKIDLRRYGIYKNSKETDEYKLNCLEIALIFAGIEADKINKLKTMIRTRYVPQKDLKIIAEQLKIYIALYKPICETNKHKDAC